MYFFTWPILAVGFRMDSTSLFRLYSYVLFIYIIFYLSKNISTSFNPNQSSEDIESIKK